MIARLAFALAIALAAALFIHTAFEAAANAIAAPFEAVHKESNQ